MHYVLKYLTLFDEFSQAYIEVKTPQPMCQNSDKLAPTRVWAAHFLTLGWNYFWGSILIFMHQPFHEILHQCCKYGFDSWGKGAILPLNKQITSILILLPMNITYICREIAVVHEELNAHLYWISPHFVTPSGLSAFRKELYLSSSSPSLFPHPFFSHLAYQNNYDRKCTLIQVNIPTYLTDFWPV